MPRRGDTWQGRQGRELDCSGRKSMEDEQVEEHHLSNPRVYNEGQENDKVAESNISKKTDYTGRDHH